MIFIKKGIISILAYNHTKASLSVIRVIWRYFNIFMLKLSFIIMEYCFWVITRSVKKYENKIKI